MPIPGVVVTTTALRASRGADTDTGTWFVTGFAESGPVGETVELFSMQDFQTVYGRRVNYSILYDAVETFFAEGGASCYVSRVTGPTPTSNSLTLMDRAGSPLATLLVRAKYVGDFGSRVSVEVRNGTLANTFSILVYFDGNLMESYVDMASPTVATTNMANSGYVTVTNSGSATTAPNNNPAVVAVTALGGSATDDHTNATESNWTSALLVFDSQLGAGQVSAPGRTTLAAQQALIAHAVLNNRVAYLDVQDKASRSALVAAAASLAGTTGVEIAGLFGSWYDIPGVIEGTTRAVPGSAFHAGVTNRLDALAGTASRAPAGLQARAQFALAVRLPTGGLTEGDYTTLNTTGIVMGRTFASLGVAGWGYRSLSTDSAWFQLNWGRERMSLVAKATAAAEEFVFRTIDGRGTLFGELEGVMAAILDGEYTLDGLYGAQPEDAYRVDVGVSVNTPTSIAAGEIRASLYARFSPHAELVRIDIVKVPLTGSVV